MKPQFGHARKKYAQMLVKNKIVRTGRVGRPTAEESDRRHDELLDSALNQFLEKGFEMATVETIAASVNMAKRTVYKLYSGKSDLFLASVKRAIHLLSVEDSELQALQKDTLSETLKTVAIWRINQVMTPRGLTLQRILGAESYRFPEIFTLSLDNGARSVINFVADQIRSHADESSIAYAQPERAARAFSSMTIGGAVRYAVSGNALDPQEIEDKVNFAVALFLEGVKLKK